MVGGAAKRISKELAECAETPPEGMTVTLASEDDLHNWRVQMRGPKGTLYEDGSWEIRLRLPAEYPFKPPEVFFATKIFHPNVADDERGGVCLAILKPDAWKPPCRVRAVLEALRQIILEPNPDDPLNNIAADKYLNDYASYKEWVAKYIKDHASAGK